MVGILDLPFELREQILLDLIRGTTQQQPEDPDSAKRDGGYEVMANTGMMTEFWGMIRSKPLPGHSMPLLLVDGKIEDEIIEFMPGRLGHRVDDAKVDAMFEEDPNYWRLWATWLSAPFPTNNLNTLHAQIREFQTLKSVDSPHPDPSSNDDCKYWVNNNCAKMLLQFLTGWLRPRQGENSIYEAQTIRDGDGSRTTSRTIQNLVIDIPVEPDRQDSLEERMRCMHCPVPGGYFGNGHYHRRIPSGRRAALILAQSLHKQLLYFFEMAPRWSPWTPLRLPKIALESIGTIHINVTGRLFAKMDLGQILAKLPHNEEWKLGGFSRAEFFQWKRAAEEKRKSSGFPVVEDSIQEHELAGSAGFIASILFARGGSLVREVTIPSEDELLSATQPGLDKLDELDEYAAFTGSAMLIQEDGGIFPGIAMFCSSMYSPVYTADFQRTWLMRRPHEWCRLHYPLEPGVLRPQDGELVLFTGEAILFPTGITTSIISGQATFYGRAGETITEHPGSIKVVSP